jgi:hypothetical protein
MMEAVRTSETSVYFKEATCDTSQKALIFILAAVRTSNLTRHNVLVTVGFVIRNLVIP